jgi:hypothetical protein
VISGTTIRERVHASADADKLHALLGEVLRSEASLVAKNFKGQFQFVMNAVKGVSREFMQAVEDDAAARQAGAAGAAPGGVVRNSRNIALADKKANLQSLISALRKEEAEWIGARELIQKQQDEERSAPAERPITDVSMADVLRVQDVVTQSVQGISLQVRKCAFMRSCAAYLAARLHTCLCPSLVAFVHHDIRIHHGIFDALDVLSHGTVSVHTRLTAPPPSPVVCFCLP